MHVIVLNNGTTPFGITCPRCNDLECYSNFYRITEKAVTATEAFYRPSVLPDDEASRQFVLSGCLLHAPLEKALSELLRDDPITNKTTYEQFVGVIADVYKVSDELVQSAVNSYGNK